MYAIYITVVFFSFFFFDGFWPDKFTKAQFKSCEQLQSVNEPV